MSFDDKLEGWDAALLALIAGLEKYKRGDVPWMQPEHSAGWDDAIWLARELMRKARTNKGFLVSARSCHWEGPHG